MKRLGFFLAVFSVGLVLFLIGTGQFTKIFNGSGSGKSVETSRRDSGDDARNEVVYHSIDLNKGRDRFSMRGRTDGTASLDPSTFSAAQSFHDAVIDIPLYSVDKATQQEVVTNFRLEAETVVLDTEKNVARMSGKIRGTGEDDTRFETTDVSLRWDKDTEKVWLEGDAPVSFTYPRLRLHGEGGLEALFDGATGLRHMKFPPPVVVAVDRGFMGFEASPPRTDEESSLIFIHSPKAPLTIDRLAGGAEFGGLVKIFSARISPRAALFPPPEIADTRMTCSDLKLTFDPEAMAFTRARAQKGPDGPIRAQLASDYTLEGNTLDWNDGKPEARLTGAVKIAGPLGTFTADEARLYPQAQHCVLEGNVRAGLEAEPWHFLADRVEVDYDPDADRAILGPRARIRQLRATSRKPNGIVVTETIPGGARVLGSTVAYDRDSDALRISPATPGTTPRPVFHEGPNRIESDAIVLSMKERRLIFEGRVEGRLESVERATGSAPGQDQPEASPILRWLPQGKEGEHADVRCEELSLEWNDEQRLHRITARRGEGGESVHLSTSSQGESISLNGDTVRWVREFQSAHPDSPSTNRLILEGRPGHQRLATGDVQVSAQTLRFDTGSYRLQADSPEGPPVRLVAARSRILGAAAENPSGGEVILECRSLDAEIRRSGQSQGVDAAGNPLDWSPVVRAKALGGPAVGGNASAVSITDGVLSAQGSELTWSDNDGTLTLEGADRQRLTRLGAAGTDELSAERIVFSRNANRVTLEGIVRGMLYQVDPDPHRGDIMSWQFESGSAQIDLASGARSGFENRVPLMVERVVTRGGVTLKNPELQAEFRGSECEWDRAGQRLHITSPDRREWQIFHRGQDPRDEITARSISVVRVAGGGDIPDHINVLFDDVTEATFHHQDQGSSADVPGTFRLDTDHLMLILEEQNGDRIDVREAVAWGEVDFRGGPYKAYATRCIFTRADDRLVFLGTEDDPVRLLGPTPLEGRSVTVEKTSTGYRIEKRGRSAWRVADIERMVEKHGQKNER